MVVLIDQLDIANLSTFSVSELPAKEKSEVEAATSARKIALYDFMPYGAPELLDIAEVCS